MNTYNVLTPFQTKVLLTVAAADQAGKDITVESISRVLGVPQPEIIETLAVLKAHAFIEGEPNGNAYSGS